MNNSVTSVVVDLGSRKITLTVSEARKLREELDRLFLIERKEFFRNPDEITITPMWAYWPNWQVKPIESEVPSSATPSPYHSVCIALQ